MGTRRLNRGAWVALLAACAVTIYNLTAWVWPLWQPGDGWVYADLVPRDGQVRLIASRYLMPELPSPLRPGDEVLAIGGVPAETILRRAFTLSWQRPAGWEAGGEVIYRVRRAEPPGEVADVLMPIVRPPASAPLRYAWPTWHQAVASLMISLTLIGIGGFVFWRRPDEPPAHVLLVFGAAVGSGLTNLPITGASLVGPGALLGVGLSPWQFAIIPSIVYLMLVFPVPKPVVRRYPRLVVLVLFGTGQAVMLAILFATWGRPAATLAGFYAVYAIQTVAALLLLLVSVGHSWLTLKEATARAQLRWITFGVLAGFMLGALAWTVATLFFSFSGLFAIVAELLFLILPLCLGVAVLRYRLFDIDILINRALVYGSLTALLALAYFASVVVLQGAVGLLTGEAGSEVVTVISTLAIAALFTPLRQRVQGFIDRRFYRRKYDAAKTLAAFGGTLRDEVELAALESRLLDVVDETMQPVRASLWIRGEQGGG